MSLGYILTQVGNRIGLNQADTNERTTLLRFINTAAREIYNSTDMIGSLTEELFKVNGNQTIALPDYVGRIRAMRDGWNRHQIEINQMRARYNEFNWSSEVYKWRLKGIEPLQTSIQNQSVLSVSVKRVEDNPIVVTVSGKTLDASNAGESLTMDSTTKTTINRFVEIKSLTKNRVNDYDIIISDIDNNQISFIPNNRLSAQFQIVDVSEIPFSPMNHEQKLNWIELLFKRALPELFYDYDEFPASGYDDIIVNKSIQLWYEEQADASTAIAYQQKCTSLMAQINEDQNRGSDDVISLASNPHQRLFNRVGYGRYWRGLWKRAGR